MKKKILVANRSEIACRIFQSVREMGMSPVGIVAPGDESARHLTYADEIHRVSGYLEISSIVEAARKSGAVLIHPGYGFLSERPAFARAVEKAGLIFIGPSRRDHGIDGRKNPSQATSGGTCGSHSALGHTQTRRGHFSGGKKIGFPLLIKASAGGGGKGMRVVNELGHLKDAAESASAEAQAAFGDGTLFLERLLVNPRHIEVQVFGDGRGGGVHLHERECSLQRRHQKVWEEATAPHLSDATREKLFTAALNLVRATKYRNAGTLEFLLDASGSKSGKLGADNVYFLEMNTRLQVEHPVTEAVTGVDLVAAQIAQALDPEKPFFKDTPPARGHAIELRLYAEDPLRDFMPTPGQITRLKWPTGTGIRIESGIEEGQQIGIQFDSMLRKTYRSRPGSTPDSRPT